MFLCCCLSCGSCPSKRSSILVTFTNDGTWANAAGCGCFEGAPNSCVNYQGSTYEVPIHQYFPYAGGSGSDTCIYRMPGECNNHYILISIFTKYQNDNYAETELRVQIFRTTESGCGPLTGTLFVSVASEDPFDCDATRNVPIASGTPGFGSSFMCTVTDGIAVLESP